MDPPDENGGNVLRRTGPGMKVTGAATEGAPAADGTGTRQVTSLDGSTTVVSTPPAGTTGTTGTTESSNTTGSNPPAQPPPAATKAETTTSNNTGGSGSTSAPAAEPQGPPACPANAKKGATTMKDKDGKEVPCTPAGKESSSKKKTGIKKIIPFGGN
jgi:hypothetical protein